MAEAALTSYQIVLIIILGLNLLFWIVVICWRVLFMDGVIPTTRRCCRAIRSCLQISPPQNSTSPRAAESGEAGRGASDLPPPYEEAIKYPSVSSLLSSTDVTSASATGHTNPASDCCPAIPSFGAPVSLRNVNESGPSSSYATSPGIRRASVRSLSCNDLESLSKPMPPAFHTVVH